MPVTAAARLRTVQGQQPNDSAVHRTFARLRPGVSLEQAAAAVRLVGQRHGAEGWTALPAERAIVFDDFARPGRSLSLAVLALSAAVFLIACANLMNLFLARSLTRRGEFATRLAAGACPRDIRRLVMVEVAVIALAAVVLAVGVAELFSAVLARISLPELDGRSIHIDAEPDIRAIVAALVLAFLAARAIGLLPARQAALTNPAEILSMSGTGQTTASAKTRRTQRRLVVVQVALSVMLVLLAALVVRNARRVLPLSDRPIQAAVARVNLGLHRIAEPEGHRVFDRILSAAKTVPGVRTAGLTSTTPDGRGGRLTVVASEGAYADLPECSPSHRAGCQALNALLSRVVTVSPGYVSAVGLPLQRGRDCGAADVAGAPLVAIVDERLAARLWPGQHPLAFLVLRATGTTVGVLGAIGFAIALIGVYGVVAYTVQQRSRELAIRKALGATTASVYRLVLWSGFRMLALGALLGVLIAAGVTGVLRSTIYALSTFDPVTFIGVPTALVAIGLLASWLAARRGVGVDPNQALKNL